MEVIKNNCSQAQMLEVTCPHCGSILRCTLEEKENSSCPVCGRSLSHTEDSTNTHSPKELHCDKCNHNFFVTDYEGIGMYGEYYSYCPECCAIVYADDGIEVTTENLALEYFSPLGEDAKKISFPEIKKWIKTGVDYLKSHPGEYMWYICSGNSFVLVSRDDNEFYVMWTNNYRDVWVTK